MTFSDTLPTEFLPRKSVKLGRLITSLKHPYQNYHDPPLTSTPKVLKSSYTSYKSEEHDSSSSDVGFTVSPLMSTHRSKCSGNTSWLDTTLVRTYRLDHSDSRFSGAMRIPATRNWLEQSINSGRKMFMIVGYHTITDASVSQQSAVGKTVQGSANIPVSLALSAATGFPMWPLLGGGSVVDPKMEGKSQSGKVMTRQFVMPGQFVCVLEYREIRQRWLSWGSVDSLNLGKLLLWPPSEDAGDTDTSKARWIEQRGQPRLEPPSKKGASSEKSVIKRPNIKSATTAKSIVQGLLTYKPARNQAKAPTGDTKKVKKKSPTASGSATKKKVNKKPLNKKPKPNKVPVAISDTRTNKAKQKEVVKKGKPSAIK